MEFGSLSLFWLATSLLLVIVYFMEQHPSAPNFLRSLFRWGKTRVGFVKGSNHFYEVPKRWFQHYYIFASLANCTALVLFYRCVYMGEDWPAFLKQFLELLQYPAGNSGLSDAVPVFLALSMELVQVGRRCWETLCVNVFSTGATMTLLHYLLGFVFYLSISLCVLAGTDFHSLSLSGTISAVDVAVYCVAVAIFLAASVLQHQSFKILAALRTTDKDSGRKKQGTYPLPRGGLFELVSCPHFLAEILVYFSLCVLFRFQNVPVLCLFVFVLVNQVLAGLLNHQWYCKNFPGVADRRRAVFPYLL